MTSVIHFNIGSNIGDRAAQIERAVALLLIALRPLRFVRSAVVESEPWGYASPHAFLNMGLSVVVECDVDPLRVLDIARGAERMISSGAHRDSSGGYADRRIDIDIITIETDGRELRLDTPQLTLPHPRAAEREFVMVPLAQCREALRKARL